MPPCPSTRSRRRRRSRAREHTKRSDPSERVSHRPAAGLARRQACRMSSRLNGGGAHAHEHAGHDPASEREAELQRLMRQRLGVAVASCIVGAAGTASLFAAWVASMRPPRLRFAPTAANLAMLRSIPLLQRSYVPHVLAWNAHLAGYFGYFKLPVYRYLGGRARPEETVLLPSPGCLRCNPAVAWVGLGSRAAGSAARAHGGCTLGAQECSLNARGAAYERLRTSAPLSPTRACRVSRCASPTEGACLCSGRRRARGRARQARRCCSCCRASTTTRTWATSSTCRWG